MSLDAELDADLHTALVEMGVIQTNGAGQPPSISGSAVDAAGRFAGPPPPRLSPLTKPKPAVLPPNSTACTVTAQLPAKVRTTWMRSFTRNCCATSVRSRLGQDEACSDRVPSAMTSNASERISVATPTSRSRVMIGVSG
jgi:hypothetical protein